MSDSKESGQHDLSEPELISIIEGPPPNFQFVDEQWTQSLQESTTPYEMARCDTRTFNGPKMLARCRRAWDEKRPVMLEFRDLDGLKHRVEVCGVRYEKLDDGTLLQLWVRLPVEMQLIEIEQGDDDSPDED